MPSDFDYDVVVVGGAGHVGLPLAIAFADRGAKVQIYDVSNTSVELVNRGVMPFLEPGAEPMLQRALDAGMLRATTDAAGPSPPRREPAARDRRA